MSSSGGSKLHRRTHSGTGTMSSPPSGPATAPALTEDTTMVITSQASSNRESNSGGGEGLTDRERDVDLYVRNCKAYGVPVDPSVVTTLLCGWDKLILHEGCREGCMLPLLDVLKRPFTTVTTLRLFPLQVMKHGTGNTNAKILADILEINQSITDIDVSRNGIGTLGLAEIARVLKVNKTLMHLSIRSNHFRPSAGLLLADALRQNTSLQFLDISNNRLGFDTASAIREAMFYGHSKPDGTRTGPAVSIDNGNYVIEEILNSVTHGVGAVISLVATAVLLFHSSQSRNHFWSAFVYCVSLTLLYTCSTLYHSFFLLPKWHHIMQIVDHAAIYVLIAGTYTPLMMVGMRDVPAAKVIVTAEWVCAFVGMILSIYVINSRGKAKIASIIELMLYVFMGWMAVFIWSDVKKHVADALPYVLGGGIFYTLGVIVFLLDTVHPMFHPVFHLFVMAGSILHYFGILFYVVWCKFSSIHMKLNRELQ